MKKVGVRLYAELNDHLSEERRFVRFPVSLSDKGSLRDLLSLLGIEPGRVDLALVNGVSVNFEHMPAEGADVSLFPVFEAFDVSALTKVRPTPLREIRFLCDAHLGRLGRYLRLLGFDTECATDDKDSELVRRSLEERRALLSRDRLLVQNPRLSHVYRIRSEVPRAQLREVLERFDIRGQSRPFVRCLVCNGLLEEVPKAGLQAEIPEHAWHAFQTFFRCGSCRQIFWRGTHVLRMQRFVDEIIANPS